MRQKNFDYVPPTPSHDAREHVSKHNLSNYDYDLFHEERDVVEKVVRIRRFNYSNKGESWKVFEDNKVVVIIEAAKLSMKEREFLRTVDGVTFMLAHYKSGWKSLSGFKQALKEKLKKTIKK